MRKPEEEELIVLITKWITSDGKVDTLKEKEVKTYRTGDNYEQILTTKTYSIPTLLAHYRYLSSKLQSIKYKILCKDRPPITQLYAEAIILTLYLSFQSPFDSLKLLHNTVKQIIEKHYFSRMNDHILLNLTYQKIETWMRFHVAKLKTTGELSQKDDQISLCKIIEDDNAKKLYHFSICLAGLFKFMLDCTDNASRLRFFKEVINCATVCGDRNEFDLLYLIARAVATHLDKYWYTEQKQEVKDLLGFLEITKEIFNKGPSPRLTE